MYLFTSERLVKIRIQHSRRFRSRLTDFSRFLMATTSRNFSKDLNDYIIPCLIFKMLNKAVQIK